MSLKNKGNSFLKQETLVINRIHNLGFQRPTDEWADAINVVVPHDCCF